MSVVKSIQHVIRKNSAGSDFIRRRINLVEGTNVTLTVADDSTNNETDVTIAAASGTPAFTDTIIKKMYTSVMLNTYRTLDHTAGGFALNEDGLVDAFESEAGVDTGTSTNESYDSANDLYAPSLADGTEESNTTDMAEAGLMLLNYNADYQTLAGGFKITNARSVTKVIVSLNKVGSPTGTMTMTIETDSAGSPSGTPVTNGTANTVAESGLSTSFGEITFTFATPPSLSAATQYHIVITSNRANDTSNHVKWNHGSNTTNYANGDGKRKDSGGTWTTQRDVYFKIIYNQIQNMTLQSNAFTAQAAPTNARLMVLEVNVDSVTVNTDIKGYVSRDGGTTFTQVTLVDEGDTEATAKQILVANVDISAQPSGTSMKWKVTTLNNKDMDIHGVGLMWD